MGRVNNKQKLVEWLKAVKQDTTVFTRYFMTLEELYNIYLANSYDHDEGEKMNMVTFSRNVNTIIRSTTNHDGLIHYKNFRRQVHRTAKCRSVTYIIVNDNEIERDLNVITIYKTGKRSIPFNPTTPPQQLVKKKPTLSDDDKPLELSKKSTLELSKKPTNDVLSINQESDDEFEPTSDLESLTGYEPGESPEPTSNSNYSPYRDKPDESPEPTRNSNYLPSSHTYSNTNYSNHYHPNYPNYPSYPCHPTNYYPSYPHPNYPSYHGYQTHWPVSHTPLPPLSPVHHTIPQSLESVTPTSTPTGPPITVTPLSTDTIPTVLFDKDTLEYITSCKILDFDVTPRVNIFCPWIDEDIRLLTGKKRATDHFRMYMVGVATGFNYKNLPYKQQLELADAVVKRESYVAGFVEPVCTARHFHDRIWTKIQNSKRLTPSATSETLKSQAGKNRQGYIQKVTKKWPTMLHGLYRFATKLLGHDETAERLAAAMNTRAAELFPDCDVRNNMQMNRHRFWQFFYLQGGRLKHPTTKPHLKAIHIQNRLLFSKRWLQKLAEEEGLYYCFLDEKWFYTTSRRRKEKHLPQADFESLEESFIVSRKVKNRRHPCKVMFLGIVGPPIEGKTDGRIFMKRVSAKCRMKQAAFNFNFSPFYEETNRLKMGEWKKLFSADEEDISIKDFLSTVCRLYKVESHVSKDLCLVYRNISLSPRAKNVETEICRLRRDDISLMLKGRMIDVLAPDKKSVLTRPMTLDDLELKVEIPQGREVVKDINCNSQFMIDSVDEIGASIRAAYSFLPSNHPIYLFMDNAGGHGTIKVKEEYVAKLKEKYSVFIEWQVPHSPETNMLDLGVWMSIQSKVEAEHRLKVMHRDVLAASVETAFWSRAVHTSILKNVHDRWKLVLELIIAGKGSNDLVEKHRGLKSKLHDLPDVPDSDDEVVVEEMLKKAEHEDVELIHKICEDMEAF